MKEEVRLWVSTCPRCQAKGKEALQERLHPVQMPLQPFHQVAMDIKYMPMSRAGHAYIIVAIDYFPKGVECQALQTTTSIDIFNFFVENIITRHSVSRVIITDYGFPFQGRHIAAMCQSLHIKHYFSTVYHPQTNGLYSYNTTRQDSTRYSPFQLLYGHHPNMPLNNHLDSHNNQPLNEEIGSFETIKSNLAQIRTRATINIEKAKQRQQRYIDKRILDQDKEHKLPFRTGELVLKLSSRAVVTPVATIDDNYQGPFV
ncbi:hypothetical protein A0J61_11827, partial [Choanephora cucurbitarum]